MRWSAPPQRTARAAVLCVLFACSNDGPNGPYMPQVCEDALPLATVTATRSEEGTITLAEEGTCGQACECSATVTSCNWEFSGVTDALRLYDVATGDVELRCVSCGGDSGEDGPKMMGMLEIVRVDEAGVVGCVVDSPCGSDLRFEASWCP